MKNSRFLLFVIAVLLIFGLAACGGKEQNVDSSDGDAATAVEQTDSAADMNTAAEPTATSIPPTPTPEPTDTPQPEPTPTLEPMEELSGTYNKVEDVVDSYRSKGQMSYTMSGALSENGEQGDQMSIEFTTDWTKAENPFGYNMASTISGMTTMEGNSEENGMSEMVVILTDESAYMKFGDQWITMPRGEMEDPETFSFAVDDFVNSFEDLKRVGSETVNGIKTTHYTFSNIRDYDGFLRSMIADQIENPDDATLNPIRSEINGDIWIAKDGGYPVKVDLKTYVEMEVTIKSADGAEKTIPTTIESRTYNEIFDVNKKIVIEPPADAPKADEVNVPGFEPGTFPLPEQTIVQGSFAGMINLVSELTPEEVTSFYDDALSNMGWEKADGFAPTWSKDDISFSILISPNDDGSTNIVIMASPSP